MTTYSSSGASSAPTRDAHRDIPVAAPTSAGFERMLRNALRTEMNIRLRPMMLHTLKGPSQTILSVLHMLQKIETVPVTTENATATGGAGVAANRQKYFNWLRDAAEKLATLAETLLPQPPDMGIENTAQQRAPVSDLGTVTEDVLHLFRDEAAFRGVELQTQGLGAASPVLAHEHELKLALQAAVAGVLDMMPQEQPASVSLETLDSMSELRIQFPIDLAGLDPMMMTAGDGAGHTGTAAGGAMPDWSQLFTLRYEVPPPRSGLGWYVARHIVKDYGGSLTLENAPNAAGHGLLKLRLLRA